MNTEDIKFRLCGGGIWEASERGAYLKRVDPKGKGIIAINECAPGCKGNFELKAEAILKSMMGIDE